MPGPIRHIGVGAIPRGCPVRVGTDPLNPGHLVSETGQAQRPAPTVLRSFLKSNPV